MSNSNNNQLNIPQAREAMDRFKMQAAQEVGVNLTNGYNGHLTSREAGSVSITSFRVDTIILSHYYYFVNNVRM